MSSIAQFQSIFPNQKSLNHTGNKNEVIIKPIIYGSIALSLGKKNQIPISQITNDNEHPPTHKWCVYVRGINNEDISTFVKEVDFILHSSFKDHNRKVVEYPFYLYEVGWGEFEMKIKIHFKDETIKPIELFHPIKLFPDNQHSQFSAKKPVISTNYDEIIFVNPKPEFRELLLTNSEDNYYDEHLYNNLNMNMNEDDNNGDKEDEDENNNGNKDENTITINNEANEESNINIDKNNNNDNKENEIIKINISDFNNESNNNNVENEDYSKKMDIDENQDNNNINQLIINKSDLVEPINRLNFNNINNNAENNNILINRMNTTSNIKKVINRNGRENNFMIINNEMSKSSPAYFPVLSDYFIDTKDDETLKDLQLKNSKILNKIIKLKHQLKEKDEQLSELFKKLKEFK